MKAHPGSYALIFRCLNEHTVDAGALGRLDLATGYYVYIGSAFGPGGVAARVGHHRQISRKPHWHLDYLRPHLQLMEIWVTHDAERREHQWADQLAVLRGVRRPFIGFGASDCACIAHLFHLGFKPSFSGFRRRMRQAMPNHERFFREVVSDGVSG